MTFHHRTPPTSARISRASATSPPQLSADEALLQTLLTELSAAPGGMSLPKLCKRLGIRMSVLMRTLAYLGDERIGDAQGPGWVRTVEDGERTLDPDVDDAQVDGAEADRLASGAEPDEGAR